jgi:hypothetical protein
MSKGFNERNTDRQIVDGVKKLTGLQKILRKYPNDSTGRKKMLKQWKKYHYGWMGEMDRLEQSAEDLEDIPLALEELKEVMPDMPTEPIEIDQVPTEEQITTIRNAIGKD